VALREALDGGVGSEHRPACIGFVAIKGLDELTKNPKLLMRRLNAIMNAADLAAKELGVTPLATDVSPDGLKLILAAGVPTASEDDAPRIIEATKRICKAAPKHAAAGIHLGIVFAGDVGHPRRRSYTVMGDAVNLAARLAYKAPAGKVLASSELMRSSLVRYAARWMDPFEVKGKRAPQRAAVIGRPATVIRAPGQDWVFRGRTTELRASRASLDASGSVQIVGPAGAGSTRLIQCLTDRDERVVTVHATIESSLRPLGAIRTVIEGLAGPLAWHPIASRAFGSSPERSQSQVGEDSTLLAYFVSVVMGAWTEAAAIVIDHAQHLDEASRRVVGGLAAALTSSSLGGRRLIVAARVPTIGGLISTVELGPMDDMSIRRIALDALALPRPDWHIDAIVRLANGSPGFAVALAELTTDGEPPSSVEAIVAARIDDLSPADRQIIRELAVAGHMAPLMLAVRSIGEQHGRVADAVRRSASLVSIHDGYIHFADEMTREVAEGGLPMARRKAIHGEVFRLLSLDSSAAPAQVARHARFAGKDRDVAHWSSIAADRALGAGASEEAASHLAVAVEVSLRIGAPLGRLNDLTRRWLTASELAGRTNDVIRALRMSIAQSRRSGDRLELLLRLSATCRKAGNLRTATRHVRAARRLVSAGNARQEALVDIEQGWLWSYSGEPGRALGPLLTVLNSPLCERDPVLAFEAATLCRELYSAHDEKRAMWAARRAIREARRSGNHALLGYAYGNVAVLDDYRGRWTQAQAGYRKAEVASRRAGDVRNMMLSRMNRASILLEFGEVQDLGDALADAIRVFAPIDDVYLTSLATTLWVRAAVRSGSITSVSHAYRLVSTALVSLQGSGDDEAYGFQLAGWAEALLILGDPLQALKAISSLRRWVDRLGDGHLLPVTARRLHAIALLQLGQEEEGHRVLAEAFDKASQSKFTFEVAAIDTIRRRTTSIGISESETDIDRRCGVVSRPWFPPLR
jgi:class 3 adenylate cyclase/tetratricopeptide (TPR) repeat protein